MGDFREEIDVIPHNFASSVLKIWNGDTEVIVEGLASFTATPLSDRVSAETVASGFGQLVIDPNKVKNFKFQCAEAPPSTDQLWDLNQSAKGFSFSFTDPNSPKFNCSGRSARFVGEPEIVRDAAMPSVEWNIISIYGKMRGGSFTLVDQGA